MSGLRHNRLLNAFAAVWVILGLLGSMLGAHAAPLPDEGICHVPDPGGDRHQPAHADHGACCVLCHAPALSAGVGGAAVPLPPMRVAARFMHPRPAQTAVPAPPAPYASRAPPSFF